VDALREAELKVKGMISIFTYGFPISYENFKKRNVELHTLSSYDILLEQALSTDYINEKDFKILSKWRKNPQDWESKI
jgi:orotate phosphoribosyltransferase